MIAVLTASVIVSSVSITEAKVRRSAKRHGKRPQVTARRGPRGQQTPTAERYAEIQKALADRGYYSGPVNGQWSPDCVDALKRFQQDQKIAADGKIGSLSLIALGLGPNHDSVGDLAAKPATELPAVP